ncbi:MAG TPA: hypothetical protein DCY94_01945 [Firmicutes bacterium]|nr:hypothetical protein [Bacillota bacterium]
MNTNKIKKLEYFTDIFKGTCELYNFSPIGLPILDGDTPIEHQIDLAIKDPDVSKTNKLYYEGPAFASGEHRELGALITGYTENYRIAELITLATKILYNADIYETTVIIDTKSKELVEALELVDLVVKEEKLEKDKLDTDLAFEIIAGDYTVARGGGENGTYYFYIDYRAIEDLIEHDYKNTLDVFISPKTNKVLEDTFVISTNLKDAGFKIETDYEMKVTNFANLDADFLIIIDEEGMAKYTVHLKDLKTKDEREIMIDNLIEELFI